MSDFDTVFDALAAARVRYDDLRISGGPLAERVHARANLHHLRARAADYRHRSTESV
jgi:hypothetical protein